MPAPLSVQSYQKDQKAAAAFVKKQSSYRMMLPDEEARARDEFAPRMSGPAQPAMSEQRQFCASAAASLGRLSASSAPPRQCCM